MDGNALAEREMDIVRTIAILDGILGERQALFRSLAQCTPESSNIDMN